MMLVNWLDQAIQACHKFKFASPRIGLRFPLTTMMWLREEIEKLYNEIKAYDQSFALYDEASRRAIKMWQEKTGNKDMWPDQAHLIVWLLEELDGATGKTN
jgi:hypothetical protein